MRMENAMTENNVAGGASELTDVLERPSMKCMICGLKAYARATVDQWIEQPPPKAVA